MVKPVSLLSLVSLVSLLPALKWLMADESAELLPASPSKASWRAARTVNRIGLPVLAAQSYNPEVASLIRRAKYGPQWSAAQRLARLASRLPPPAWLDQPCCLVPVPADPSRLAQRGFHLPNLLCQVLARRWAVDYDLSRLIKSQTSPTLASLGREQRLSDLQGLIHHRSKKGQGFLVRKASRAIVLVDDVLTTGATASVCAQALQSGGDRVVGLVVLARAD